MGLLGFGIADFLASYLSKSTGYVKGMLWNTFFMFLYLLILLYLFGTHIRLSALSPLTLVTIVGAAILHTFGGLSFYKGTRVGKLSILSPIASTYSLVIILLSLLFFNEGLSELNVLAIALMILGTVFISTNLKEISNFKLVITDKSVPFGILSMLLWGTGFMLISVLTKQFGWLLATTYVTFVSLLILTLITKIKERNFFPNGTKSYWLAILLGLFSAMGYLGYSLGTETGFSSIVGPVVAAAPVVTVSLALIFLREKTTKVQLFGIFMSVIGLVLLSI